MGTDTRAASILVGAAMATAPARQRGDRAVIALGRRVDLVIAVLVIGIGASWVVVDGASSAALYRGGLLLHSAVAAVVVTALASTPTGRVARCAVVATTRVGRRALIRAVPVALAGVRDVVERAHRSRRGRTHARAHRRVDAARRGVVPDRGGPDPPPRDVGSRPARHPCARRCGRARRRDVDRAPPSTTRDRRLRPRHDRRSGSPMVQTPPSTLGPQLPDRAATSTVSTPCGRPSPDRSSTSTVVLAADASTQLASATDRAARGPRVTVTSGHAANVEAAPPISRRPRASRQASDQPSVLWTGDSIAYDLAPGVGAALTGAGLLANSSAFPGMRLVDDGQFASAPQVASRAPRLGHRRDRRAAVGLGRPERRRRSIGGARRAPHTSPSRTARCWCSSRRRRRWTRRPTADSSALTEHARAIAAANPTTVDLPRLVGRVGSGVRRSTSTTTGPRNASATECTCARRARPGSRCGWPPSWPPGSTGRRPPRRPSGHWAAGSPMPATTSPSAPAPRSE